MEYSQETLERAKKLFPVDYELHDYIINNNPDAINIIRNMDIDPFIHVNEIVEAFSAEDNKWELLRLKHKAQIISGIIALEELMLDEMNILIINNDK